MWSPFRKLLSAWRLIESKEISFLILFRLFSSSIYVYVIMYVYQIQNWESDQISKLLSQVFLPTGGRPERAPRKRLYRSAAFSGHKVFVFVFLSLDGSIWLARRESEQFFATLSSRIMCFCHCIVCEIWIQLANFGCCIGIWEYH